MKTRKEVALPENVKPMISMSAFMVFLGYWCFIQTHPALVDEKEHAIVTRVIQKAKKGYPSVELSGFMSNSLFASSLSAAFNQSFPGYDVLIGLRKLMIRQWLQDTQPEQIVVMGDGFDTRALMFGLMNQHVPVFACDRGQTRELKLSALQALSLHYQSGVMRDGGYHINGNIHYIAIDLSEDNLIDNLKNHGFDPNKKTAVLLEGVLSYLNDEEIARVMRDINGLDEHKFGIITVLLSVMDKVKYNKEAIKEKHQESHEALKSSLFPKDTIRYFGSLQFEVTGRFSAHDHFNLVGEMGLQKKYQLDAQKPENESMSHELYYELKPSAMVDLNRSLDEVPVLPLDLNLAPALRI